MRPAADEVCEVIITAPDPDWLVEFTRRLVIDRLCASGHNFQPIRTIYRPARHPARQTVRVAGKRPTDERIQTTRLVLVPVRADDAEELVAVFADERLSEFTGGKPGSVEDLRRTLGRLAQDRAADPTAQLNWVVRRLNDGEVIGMLQAVFSSSGRAAEIAWLVGVPWQGQGLASEATKKLSR